MMARRLRFLSLCLMVGCGASTASSDGAAEVGAIPEIAEMAEITVEPDAAVIDAACTPSCDGKVCGDDGCGGLCGKCSAGQPCVAGQCVDDTPACVPADSATCGWKVEGVNLADSAQATSVFSTFDDCTSPGEIYPGAEVVIQFVPTDDEVVSLDGFAGASVFVLEDDGSGCRVDSPCISHAVGAGSFTARKGHIYYLVFESSAATAPFDVGVSCCVLQCEEGNCGPDGCGGMCGPCQPGQTCNDDLCVAVPDAVWPSLDLSCDSVLTGLSGVPDWTVSDGLNTYPGCSNETFPSPEIVASFVPSANVVVTVTTSVDMFFLDGRYGDPIGACLPSVDGGTSFRADVGRDYWIALETPELEGITFDVAVTCCERVCDGTSCDDGCGGSCVFCGGGYCDAGQCVPFLSECTPKQAVTCGDHVIGQNLFNSPTSKVFSSYSCPDGDGWDFSMSPEVVYSFVTDTDQRVTLVPAGDTEYGLSGDVAVIEDNGQGCADAAGACLVQSRFPTFDSKAGVTYSVIWEVETEYGASAADFGFVVYCCPWACAPGACGMADGCGGICGCDSATEKCGAVQKCEPLGKGESCADPFVLPIASLPVTVEGDLSFSGTQFSSDAYTCSTSWGTHNGDRDHVYSFTAPEEAIYRFSATSETGAYVYVLSNCVGAANSSAGCIDHVFDDQGHYGNVYVPMTSGQTVFVVVDRGWPSDSGSGYTLTASAPCHPVCDSAHCGNGSDGCGGSCGCQGQQVCNVNGLCQALGLGDSCATALPIPSQELPVSVSGDLAASLVETHGKWCGSFHQGLTRRIFYVFTPAVTGKYAIDESNPPWNHPSFAVVHDCGGASESCLADASPVETSSSTTVALEAGVPVYIIVDSQFSPSWPFTLTISLKP